jgi:serine/threonine-protein kinase RsbW
VTAPGPVSEVRLTFPAKPDYLLLARLALVGLARSLPFDADIVADLKLAVTEACGNVVRHAYPQAEGHVALTYAVRDDRFEIVVEDDGPGLLSLTDTPEELLRAPARDISEAATQGMGMAIIRAVVDELDVGTRSGGPGTRVRMTKLLERNDP